MFLFSRNTMSSYFYFIYEWFYSPLFGPGLFFTFVIFYTQAVGLLGRVISPSQGRYLHTGQCKHRINAHTHIHSLSVIRTHDPSVRASEDNSCIITHSHCSRHFTYLLKHLFAAHRGFTDSKTKELIN
jgi:hypothetical protein